MPGPMKDIQGGHLEPYVNTVSEFLDYQSIVFEDSSSLNTQLSVPQFSHTGDTVSMQQGPSISASKKSNVKQIQFLRAIELERLGLVRNVDNWVVLGLQVDCIAKILVRTVVK